MNFDEELASVACCIHLTLSCILSSPNHSNVFNQVEANSIEIWKFNMFFLVIEYSQKTVLPIPLNVIETLIEFFLYLHVCLRKRKTHDYGESTQRCKLCLLILFVLGYR
ncbi:unnamed protein product [Protopolystoma xenopodis]|uniref:Uncharacterized protein n=1 Tax=Protopolystoma xenopodis TaxID=117903 RepID=A0A3S5BPD3_9PLAT|nr:unnamed protein product [Protopolystoma xenopodis]